MNGAMVSVESNCERREDCVAVSLGPAFKRFIDKLETRLNSDSVAREKRELRGAARQSLEGREAVRDRELTNGVHLGVQLEWGDSGPSIADLGDSKTDLRPDVRQWIGSHELPPVKRRVSQIG